MDKIDWKQKLTSRKLWAALIGFISAVALSLGFDENQTAQIGAVIMAGATLIAYIIGEGLVDASRNKGDE